jgi:hypothetical protein
MTPQGRHRTCTELGDEVERAGLRGLMIARWSVALGSPLSAAV